MPICHLDLYDLHNVKNPITLIEPEVISFIMAKFEMTKISICKCNYFWLFDVEIVLLSECPTLKEGAC